MPWVFFKKNLMFLNSDKMQTTNCSSLGDLASRDEPRVKRQPKEWQIVAVYSSVVGVSGCGARGRKSDSQTLPSWWRLDSVTYGVPSRFAVLRWGGCETSGNTSHLAVWIAQRLSLGVQFPTVTFWEGLHLKLRKVLPSSAVQRFKASCREFQ